MTKAIGNEIGTMSYLAPFFNISILYEDDHKLGDHFFNVLNPSDNSVVNTLIREIEFSRVSCGAKAFADHLILNSCRLFFTKLFMEFWQTCHRGRDALNSSRKSSSEMLGEQRCKQIAVRTHPTAPCLTSSLCSKSSVSK